MKAIIKTEHGAGMISYMDTEKLQPKRGQVLIKVAYAGICGTDLKIRSGHFGCNPPVILGHEYSGVIEAVGEGVTRFKPGDRVISETAGIVCGKCEYCMSGNYLMCDDRLSIGYGTNGAMGEYIAIREEIVHPVPDSISLEEAALCEPAAVAFHAVFDYTEIKPFHTVLVTGPGTIGQLVAQTVKSTGARVILTGTSNDEFRLNIAEKLGIETIVSDQEDVVEYITKITDGKMADYAFDCSGAGVAISQALHCLRKKGSLVQVGLTKDNISIDYGLLPMRELSVKGAFGHLNSSWVGVLKLMELKKIDVKPLITDKFDFKNWEKGFDRAEHLNCIKVLLHP